MHGPYALGFSSTQTNYVGPVLLQDVCSACPKVIPHAQDATRTASLAKILKPHADIAAMPPGMTISLCPKQTGTAVQDAQLGGDAHWHCFDGHYQLSTAGIAVAGSVPATGGCNWPDFRPASKFDIPAIGDRGAGSGIWLLVKMQESAGA